MDLADFSVRRAVAASMMVLIVLVLGAVSYFLIPIDIMPDMTFPVVMVQIDYEGVGPEEIENSVTKLAEEALSRVDGVKNLTSVSLRGVAQLVIEFEWGTNLDGAVVDVREKLDEIPDFMWPDDADRPRIRKFDPADIPLMGIALYGGGNDVHQLQKIAEDYCEDALVGVEGVASVSTLGGPPREVLISVDQDRLAAHNLALQTVLERLASENYNLSAGSMKEGYKDYLVRALGEFDNVREIKAVVLGMAGGAPIRLGDVATVFETFGDEVIIARNNGAPSVMLMLTKQSGANTVAVSAKVWEKVAEIKKQLPPGIVVTKTFDTADFINEAIQNVRGNLLWGGMLAIGVLLVFLRHIRPTLIIAVAIPISLLTALIPMYFLGTTINMMSLGGLALATGMLVDNAIVVLENIYRRQEDGGENRMDAARRGAREVAGAITGSTLTTIVVFLPIAFTQGFAARLFRDLALTVTFALAASLFTAITLVPMLASRLLSPARGRSGRGALMRQVTIWYRGLVRIVIANRWRVFLAGNLLWMVSLSLAFFLESEFLPTPNDVTIMVTTELPRGVRLEETDRISRLVEDILGDYPEILSARAIIGLDAQRDSPDPRHASFILTLSKQSERERTVAQIVDDIRRRVQAIPGIEQFNFVNLQSQSMGAGGGKPIEIKIFGKNLETLVALSNEALDRLKQTEGVLDPEASLTYGDPEVQVRFDRERAAQLGMPISFAADLMEAAIKGKTASRYRSQGEEYDIVVRLDKDDRDSVADIGALQFITPTGARAQLSDFADVRHGAGPTHVFRENQKRAATIFCNYGGYVGGRPVDLGGRLRHGWLAVTGGDAEPQLTRGEHLRIALFGNSIELNGAVKRIKEALEGLALPPGYYIEFGGQYERMVETFTDLGFAAALAVLLVYMIMAALFESLVLPLAIMLSVPFAFVGSLWALLLTGTTLSAVSGIGTILLAGIVVNNGIVMVDYANQCRIGGLSQEAAIIKACVTRLRPILMTNLTTILALIPMAVLGGAGVEMRRPLAISVIGGLTFGVILTLVLLPAAYLLLSTLGERVSRATMRWLHGEEDETAMPAARD